MTTPTPEQLAAADAIDVKRYEGHTLWLCVDSCVASDGDGSGQWFIYDSIENDDPPIGTAHHYDQKCNEPNARLWADAPLIPALIHQRDELRQRIAVLEADAELARAAIALAEYEVNSSMHHLSAAASLRVAYRAAKAARENKG